LQLDFVLDNERLALGVDGLGELGRDGMVGSLVLDDQALVALNALQFSWLLNGPVANVGPFLLGGGVLLFFFLGMGRLPPRVPVVCELFQEGGLQVGRLETKGERAENGVTATNSTYSEGRLGHSGRSGRLNGRRDSR
jgi:hypothetical protein